MSAGRDVPGVGRVSSNALVRGMTTFVRGYAVATAIAFFVYAVQRRWPVLVRHPGPLLVRYALADLGFALWLWWMARVGVGAVRLLTGGQPGGERDLVRRAAAFLAPRVRATRVLLGALLASAAALAVAGWTSDSIVFLRGPQIAVVVLLWALERTRHLAWFATKSSWSDERRSRLVRWEAAQVPVPALGGLVVLAAAIDTLVLQTTRTTAALEPAAPSAAYLVMLCGWGLALLWALRLREVTVGADGVLVRGAFAARFYPVGRWTLAVDDHALHVARSDEGKKAQLRLPFPHFDPREVAQLVERLRQLTQPDRETLMARAELEDLLPAEEPAHGSGYRAQEVPRETLWRILETPSVDRRVRVQAAKLVGVHAAEGDAERLLEIAGELAEPDAARALRRLAKPG